MSFLPTSLGLRPRLAVELRPEGVVAARAEDAQALLAAVSSAVWPAGTLVPGLKAGNVAAHEEAVAAVRRALEAVGLKERQVTLILPDAAVRVLLLDFDALPAKASEALPVVRFRLKKLLPFDPEDAVISYQVMSQARGSVRVLAVAVPREVLAEYEALVREAGFEPGAVLPSTLAVCAGLDEDLAATLLVNAGENGVTTAIVQQGVLLLHRAVDLAAEGLEDRIASARVAGDVALAVPAELLAHPEDALFDPLESPATGYIAYEAAGLEGLEDAGLEGLEDAGLEGLEDAGSRRQMLPVEAPVNARFDAPVATRFDAPLDASYARREESAPAREILQAVSVAAAYFEDTLQTLPGAVLSAGTLGADRLRALLRGAGFDPEEVRVVETIDPEMLGAGASTTRVPRGWIAGVRGALRS